MMTGGCSEANGAADDGTDDDVAGISVVDNIAAVVSTAVVDVAVVVGGADVVSTAVVDVAVVVGGADVVSTADVDGAVVGSSAAKQWAFEL